jgi:hypothetical protein
MAKQLKYKVDRFGSSVFEALFFNGRSDALNLVRSNHAFLGH